MNDFTGRTIVLGVGGGIAAYKACELARLFVKGGAQVRVAMTPRRDPFRRAAHVPGAHRTRRCWWTSSTPEQDQSYGHLGLARGADLMVVAPATANLIARLRAGMGTTP